ncbi:MAG: PKD domain-containing protein, partial [Pirellulales bacterium]|nr:PKD domain-containing protein [Pirellulales bacterium]
KATFIYRALDRVLGYAEGTLQDGKQHDFIIHLFTDGSNNDPAPYTFDSNVERFKKLRGNPACTVELYYHALEEPIPENVAKLIASTEGMHAISGLGMPPIARFSLPEVAITDSTPVTFVNATIGQADRFDWDFGDGATSTDGSPTHTFAKPGEYTVKLVASSRAGKSQATRSITVRGGPPRADFTIEEPRKPKYVGDPVQFTDRSVGQVTSRTWKFGDGQESREVNPKHVYKTADQFVVTLQVDGPFAKKDEPSVATRILKVELPPAVDFVFFPKAPVRNAEIDFVNQSRGDFHGWQWKFGDGAASQERSPKHTYAEAGTYTVELVAQDSAGLAQRKVEELVVGTDMVKPTARFTLPLRSVGVGQELTLTDQSEGTVASRTWSMGDGAKLEGASVKHAYQKSGTFIITLTVSSAAGSSNATAELVVKPAVLDFSIRPQRPRDGSPVVFTNDSVGDYRDWKWDFGDGARSGEKHGEHTYARPGQYTARLLAVGPDGKQKEVSKKVAVQSSIVVPDAHFVLPMPTIEVGKTIRFAHTSAGTIRKTVWNMGDGTTIEKDVAEHRYSKPGQYTVTVTVSNETGSDSDSATITVEPDEPPAIDFDIVGPSKGSAPFEVEIDNRCKGPIKTYRWEYGDGKLSDDRRPKHKHTYDAPGTYLISLTVTDQKGHEYSASQSQRIRVEVLPAPLPLWVRCVLAAGSYAAVWLLAWTGLWPWNRRSIHYQEDGRPGRFLSWRKDFARREFAVVMRRTLLLRKHYRYQERETGAAAASVRGPIYDGDRVRTGCWVTTSDGKKTAVGRLNDAAWKCLVPQGIGLALAVLVWIILTECRLP